MKNTLAENMLRFGVKNLKESDVKKIARLQEQTQTGIQPYAAINAKSWKMKDDAAWTAVESIASYPVKLNPTAAAQGVYGPWAQEYTKQANATPKMNPTAGAIAQSIAEALASIMNVQGKYEPLQYKDFAYVVSASEKVSSLIKSKITNAASVPLQTIGNPRYALSPEINAQGQMTTQAQWEATLAIIAPAIKAVIQQYVLPNPDAKPITPTTTPGKTTPAPVPGKRP